MSGDSIIEVENLSKSYRIWDRPSARLMSSLADAVASLVPGDSAAKKSLRRLGDIGSHEFRALSEMSFNLRRGEAMGIIGRNGSGKSTLLQLIAGTLAPTAGAVRVRGRVSALLELGSGFNPDFTGRENVHLNGSIFGFSRAEMERRFPEIAEFADIGEFIEQPVKTYSSGMMVRLAFAVAVSFQPDILIIDEALAVGDVFFTQKCFERIREILRGGATLIFVSHDMASVQNLCNRAILLDRGSLAYDGSPAECVSRYFNLHQPRADGTASVPGRHPPVDRAAREGVVAANILPGAKSRHGDKSFEIVAAAVVDTHGHSGFDFEMMHRATVRMLLRANRAVRLPSVGLQIHDRMGNLVFAAGTPQLRFPLPAMAAGEEILLNFRVALNVQPGAYTLSLDAAEFDETNPNVGAFYDRVGGLGPLIVTHNSPGAMPFLGAAQLPMAISYE